MSPPFSDPLPEPLDVIAVGAHPDDVEIAIGGTLALLVRQGYRVGIVDLTDGEPTPGSSGPEERLAEAARAAEILGVHVRQTLDLPNRRLFDCYEARVSLAKVFRYYRPSIVLGIADKTPLASPDHWQAMQITDAAVFYSRLSKWDGEFAGLPVHTIRQLLWYPLALGSLEAVQGAGTMIIDISETLEQKLAAIRAYTTQFPPAKQRVFDLVESQARMLGLSHGTAAGEVLIAPKPVVVKDVMQTFAGPRMPRTNLDPTTQARV
jgi:bacillithiol biosynthesis deacetylase BshB1